jgi:hypothetical protein
MEERNYSSMKKIFMKRSVMKIPDRFIVAAYAGACAAHQVDVLEDWFGKDSVDFHGYFQGNYAYVRSTCSGAVKELPSRLSLREIVLSSPANREFGGF